jgi:hypothetical protein
MATLEYPVIAGLDLKTKPRLLVPGSFNPSWLPVDSVDMNHWQSGALAKLTRQRAFARPRLAHNHHPLHTNSLSMGRNTTQP